MPVVNEGERVVEWSPRIRWGKALLAGIITGAILLVIPWGSPFSGITFNSAVIMGRPVPPQAGISHLEAAVLHLALSCLYALVLAAIVTTLRPDRALIMGGLVGLALYGINFFVARSLFDTMAGPEWPVGLTHLVFGLLTTALYRGMAKRRAPDAEPGEP